MFKTIAWVVAILSLIMCGFGVIVMLWNITTGVYSDESGKSVALLLVGVVGSLMVMAICTAITIYTYLRLIKSRIRN